LSDLGPVSQAILDYIQERPQPIEIFRMIHAVSKVTKTSHSSKWYFRQLVGLHIEGRIEASMVRQGDKLGIRWRRLPEFKEAEGEVGKSE